VRNRHGKATDHYLSVGEELVVLPRGDYEELVDALAAQEIDTALARREEELLSAEEASALVATSSPIAFWRSKRGMTLALLAGEVGVSEGFLSELESGNTTADVTLYGKLADSLHVLIDDLVA
jgi:DNA-binding XRE family transcriptional regulator